MVWGKELEENKYVGFMRVKNFFGVNSGFIW